MVVAIDVARSTPEDEYVPSTSNGEPGLKLLGATPWYTTAIWSPSPASMNFKERETSSQLTEPGTTSPPTFTSCPGLAALTCAMVRWSDIPPRLFDEVNTHITAAVAASVMTKVINVILSFLLKLTLYFSYLLCPAGYWQGWEKAVIADLGRRDSFWCCRVQRCATLQTEPVIGTDCRRANVTMSFEGSAAARTERGIG